MFLGKITQWNDEKGFGFITEVSNKEKLFFHVSSFKSKGIRPDINQEVCFLKSQDSKGRSTASDIKIKGESSEFGPVLKAFILGALCLLGIAVLSFFGYFPELIVVFYLFMSLLTFMFYAWDKRAAKKSKRRIPDTTLHHMSLLCGWPGAMYAQQLFRHKSYKPSFRRGFYLTMVVNLMGLLYLLSPYGHWLVDKINQIKVLELLH